MSIRQSAAGISFVSAVLLACATAFAQPNLQAAQPQIMPGQPNSAPTNTDSSASPADGSFVEDTMKGNEAQVEMSQLAKEKSPSDDVKEFSQRMVQIHTQLNQQLAPLAKQLEVDETPKLSKQQKKQIAQLALLSGSDFDTAYLQAMAKEQEHSLKQFKSEENTQNPTIKNVVKLDGPALAQHYDALVKVAQTHNVTLTSAK